MTTNLPTLRWGSKGPHVVMLQGALNDCTFRLKTKLETDGVFGRLTYGAVKLFQEENKPLEIDGIVGPKTWAVLDRLYGEVLKKARHRLPENCDYPVQHTPDDCGYFSHYCLAEVNAANSLSVRFTEKQVLDARDEFNRSQGRSGTVYLAPDFSVDFLNQLKCFGFKKMMAAEYFKAGSNMKVAAKYLSARVGMGGAALVLNRFTVGGDGHWIAVPSWKVIGGNYYFFVYDSSSTFPRLQKKEGFPAGNTMCWIDYVRFFTWLKQCNVGSIICKF